MIVQRVKQQFGLQLFGQRREAADVGKQDRDGWRAPPSATVAGC
jgi:hypothetical protein